MFGSLDCEMSLSFLASPCFIQDVPSTFCNKWGSRSQKQQSHSWQSLASFLERSPPCALRERSSGESVKYVIEDFHKARMHFLKCWVLVIAGFASFWWVLDVISSDLCFYKTNWKNNSTIWSHFAAPVVTSTIGIVRFAVTVKRKQKDSPSLMTPWTSTVKPCQFL